MSTNPTLPTTGDKATVLHELMQSAGAVVSMRRLVAALFGPNPEAWSTNPEGHVRSTVTKLRRHLPEDAITARYGVGYALSAEIAANLTRHWKASETQTAANHTGRRSATSAITAPVIVCARPPGDGRVLVALDADEMAALRRFWDGRAVRRQAA